MMNLRSEPSQTFIYRKALCVFQPLRLYPSWETLIAGIPMDGLAFEKLPPIKKALLWKSRVMYSRSNPRDLSYMLNLLRDFEIRWRDEVQVDLLLPFSLSASVSETQEDLIHKLWVFPRSLAERNGMLDEIRGLNFDTVVFLFPDPIGLGWCRTERIIARLGIPNRYVLNGRKRFFEWDTRNHRKLIWRRFLEHVWVVETMLAVLAVIVSIPLAIYDGLMKNSHVVAEGGSVDRGKRQ